MTAWINVWPWWACMIMWTVDKSSWPLTSTSLWRLSQQSKKYCANLSLASGLPFILILSLTSIKCGELQHTEIRNKNSTYGQCLLGQAHYEGVGHYSDRLVCYKLSHTPWTGGSFEKGCAPGTPEPSAYTTPGSAEFCYPIHGSTLRPVGWPIPPAFTQWRPNFYAWLPIWPPG